MTDNYWKRTKERN